MSDLLQLVALSGPLWTCSLSVGWGRRGVGSRAHQTSPPGPIPLHLSPSVVRLSPPGHHRQLNDRMARAGATMARAGAT